MSYEWVTTFVIKHQAGSEEGAIHQRFEMDKALQAIGVEVKMASTRSGDASGAGLSAFFAAAGDGESDIEIDDGLGI